MYLWEGYTKSVKDATYFFWNKWMKYVTGYWFSEIPNLFFYSNETKPLWLEIIVIGHKISN